MRHRSRCLPFVGWLIAGCTASTELPSAPDPAPTVRANGPGYTRMQLPLQDAWGVNDNGVIVGYVKGVAAYWFNGTRKVLPPPVAPCTSYYAANISEKGSIVGSKSGGNCANYRRGISAVLPCGSAIPATSWDLRIRQDRWCIATASAGIRTVPSTCTRRRTP